MPYKLTKPQNQTVDMFVELIKPHLFMSLVTLVHPQDGLRPAFFNLEDHLGLLAARLEDHLVCCVYAYEQHDGRRSHAAPQARGKKRARNDDPGSDSGSSDEAQEPQPRPSTSPSSIKGNVHVHILLMCDREVSDQYIRRYFSQHVPDVDCRHPRIKKFEVERTVKYVLKGNRNQVLSSVLYGNIDVPIVKYYEPKPHTHLSVYKLFNRLIVQDLRMDYEPRQTPDAMALDVSSVPQPNNDVQARVDILVNFFRQRCKTPHDVEVLFRDLWKYPEYFQHIQDEDVAARFRRYIRDHLTLLFVNIMPIINHQDDFPITREIIINSFNQQECLELFLSLRNLLAPHVRRTPRPFFVGPAASGKSTLMEAIRPWFETPRALCIDGRFTLQPLLDADAILHNEFGTHLMGAQDCLSFLEGGPLTVARRNKSAVPMDWRGHVILTANDRLHYRSQPQAVNDALSSRLRYFTFRALPPDDVAVDIIDRVREESAAFRSFIGSGRMMWEEYFATFY